MSAANFAVRSLRPNARTLGLWVVLALLAAFVVYAALREMRKSAPAVQQQGHAFAEQRPARSAAEERFVQAFWNIHADVRTAAVRMTFAGLAYKMGDGTKSDIQSKVAPLTPIFRNAESALRALDTPASLQEMRDRYLAALQLYGDSSVEMIRIAQDGNEAHLLKAQEMSEKAAGVLLEVGDELWPGEIKPN